MNRHPFVPEPFALGLFALGLILVFFPSLRIAGLVALLLGVANWLFVAVLKALRHR